MESTWKSWTPLALVVALVMFVAPLGIGFPLLDPDEGLHAGIAQEMVEQGDWITPCFLGEPFLDKPIIYFWAEAASLKIFGFNEAALRLPGLLFGLLGAVTTGLLAWRLFNVSLGWIAGILYATTILPTALAQAATHDVALVPWVNLAILFLWESQRGGRGKIVGCILLAGFFVGLSILTKGLTGAAVVGLAYGGYRVISRRVDLVLIFQGVVVLTVAALVAAPWYVALEMQNPGYLHYYFVDRHLLGAATDSQPHGNQPFWYYFPLLLGGGLPWIGYLPVLFRGVRGQGSGGSAKPQAAVEVSNPDPRTPNPQPLLWFWLIGWVVFLTLVRSKLVTYLWPAFPPLAILGATVWSRLFDGTLGEDARRSFARTFILSSWTGPIVLPAAVLAIQLILRVRFPWPVWAATAVVALAAPLPLIPWHAGRFRGALRAAALSLTAQFSVVMWLVLPQVANDFSARDLAEHLNRADTFPQRLLVVEERIGSVVFYLDPKLRNGLAPDRLQRLSFEQPSELSPGDVVAVPQRRIEKTEETYNLGDTPYDQSGRYRIYRIIKPRPVVAPQE